jgi:hypothetical protein
LSCRSGWSIWWQSKLYSGPRFHLKARPGKKKSRQAKIWLRSY